MSYWDQYFLDGDYDALARSKESGAPTASAPSVAKTTSSSSSKRKVISRLAISEASSYLCPSALPSRSTFFRVIFGKSASWAPKFVAIALITGWKLASQILATKRDSGTRQRATAKSLREATIFRRMPFTRVHLAVTRNMRLCNQHQNLDSSKQLRPELVSVDQFYLSAVLNTKLPPLQDI